MEHLESYTVSGNYMQSLMTLVIFITSPTVVMPLAVGAGCLWFKNGQGKIHTVDGGHYILMMFMQAMMATYICNFMLTVLPLVFKPIVPIILVYSILTQLQLLQ